MDAGAVVIADVTILLALIPFKIWDVVCDATVQDAIDDRLLIPVGVDVEAPVSIEVAT